MNDYPDSDYPYTLFMQGVALPRWANCWNWILRPEASNSSVEDLVFRVKTRIHHVWNIESEEAPIVTIAAQHLLGEMLRRPDECLQCAPPEEIEPPTREEVYAGLVEGLRKIIELAENEEVVFWAGGYASDGERLREALAQYRAGKLTPPHRVARQKEYASTIEAQRRQLRALAFSGGVEKDLRRFLHALPQRA